MSGVNTIGQRSAEGIVGNKKVPRLSTLDRRAKSTESADTMYRRLRDAVRSGVATKAMFVAASVSGLLGCLPDRLTDAELDQKIAAAQCAKDAGSIIDGKCNIPGLGDIAVFADGSGYDGYGSDAKDGGADADVIVGDTIAMDSADGEDATDDAEDSADGEDGEDGEDTTDIGPVLDINIVNDAEVAADIEEDLGIDAAEDLATDIGEDLGIDAAEDLATDVGEDLGIDAAEDLAADIGEDLGIDAAEDLATDIGEDLGIDAAEDLATDVGEDLWIDAAEDLATDVGEDLGVDAIADSATDASVDGATDSVDGPEADAADNGATDASGDLTDVNPADMAGDVTGSDGFIDSDGDGVLDSSGDVGADSTDATDATDVGPDVYVPQMCEGQPHGKVKPFYTGKPGTQGVGECAPGLFQCTDGTWINIENEVVPVEEGAKCDGKDNDCDGKTDPEILSYSGPFGTEGVGVCLPQIEKCVAGQYSLVQSAVLPSGETCDGKDNDCDGATDNATFTEEAYSGPAGTKGVGMCMAEVKDCVLGAMKTLQVQVLPAAKEIYMNGVDDNCNGKTDIEEPDGTCDENGDKYIDIEKFDPTFLNAVLVDLGKGPNDKITEAEALKVVKMNLDKMGVTGIAGIECFQKAIDINLGLNPNLSDMNSLAAIGPLGTIILTGCNVSDINAFENLSLKTAMLSNNPKLNSVLPLVKNPKFAGPTCTIYLTGTAVPQLEIDQLKAKGVIVYK